MDLYCININLQLQSAAAVGPHRMKTAPTLKILIQHRVLVNLLSVGVMTTFASCDWTLSILGLQHHQQTPMLQSSSLMASLH